MKFPINFGVFLGGALTAAVPPLLGGPTWVFALGLLAGWLLLEAIGRS